MKPEPPERWPDDAVGSRKHQHWMTPDEAAAAAEDGAFYTGVLFGVIVMIVVEAVFGLAAWGIWTWVHQ